MLRACPHSRTDGGPKPGAGPPPFQPPAADQTTIRINVNLVQVDAVVTDAKDRQVTDLKADDFQVLQDGKPLVITNFSYISIKPGDTRIVPVAVPKGTVAPPPPPPVAVKADQVRRTVALVVDDLGLSFDSIAQLRSVLKKFVEERMEPGDLVAIVRTGAGMGALQQFTADKRMLYAAIDRVRYNALGRVGMRPFAPIQPKAPILAAGDDRNPVPDATAAFEAASAGLDPTVPMRNARPTSLSVPWARCATWWMGCASSRDASRSSSSPRTSGSSTARARTTASWGRCAA